MMSSRRSSRYVDVISVSAALTMGTSYTNCNATLLLSTIKRERRNKKPGSTQSHLQMRAMLGGQPSDGIIARRP